MRNAVISTVYSKVYRGVLVLDCTRQVTVRCIEVIQFWIPPTPREIRLNKLNVSPNLYCNVLSLIVYFVGKLMY